MLRVIIFIEIHKKQSPDDDRLRAFEIAIALNCYLFTCLKNFLCISIKIDQLCFKCKILKYRFLRTSIRARLFDIWNESKQQCSLNGSPEKIILS